MPRTGLERLFFMMSFALCLFVFSQNAEAASQDSKNLVNALKQAGQGNWARARASAKGISSPAEKAAFNWYAYTKEAPNISFQEMSSFVSRHPNWPYLDKIRLHAEKNITDNVPDKTLVRWFSKNQPLTAKGMDRYARALKGRGKSSDLRRVLKNWWAGASLTRDQQREFFARYGRYLDRTSHIERMNNLLHKRKYANAMAMANVLGGGYPALAAARKALAQEAGNVNSLVAAVPFKLRQNEGLLYERLKWRRKNDLDQGAIEILNKAPRSSAMYKPANWWRERHIIARRLIENKKYGAAYRLVSVHKQKEGFSYAQAEWLSGWLALRFVKKPWQAFEHFERLYNNVKSPISKARGAYWSGRASDSLKHPEVSVKWYHVAAGYRETFYGQLAAEKLHLGGGLPKGRLPVISSVQSQKFQGQDLAKIAKWFNQAGLRKESSVFLLRLGKNARTPAEYLLATKWAESLSQRHIAIKLAQSAQKETGVSFNKYLYPTMVSELRNVKNAEWALVNALIRQESRFDYQAVSPAGARGLMQIMPATAKGVAAKSGIRHQTNWLITRPSHNIALGSRYIGQMVNRFGGNYAMAAAAYNAGPGRVDRWLDQFGDPRRGEIDFIDWLELIPIYETRNYVQRVLEGVYVYRDHLKGTQKTPTTPIHVAAR